MELAKPHAQWVPTPPLSLLPASTAVLAAAKLAFSTLHCWYSAQLASQDSSLSQTSSFAYLPALQTTCSQVQDATLSLFAPNTTTMDTASPHVLKEPTLLQSTPHQHVCPAPKIV